MPLGVRRTLRLTGFVQGVGFRPYVYRLATRHMLGGWVRNDTQGVTICIEGPGEAAALFGEELLKQLPGLARVDTCVVLSEEAVRDWTSSFTIRHSADGGDAGALITPDTYVCQDCLRELFDPADRRYRYPLINCTNCGPRFSIIRGVPYDRPNTTMADFVMCGQCQAEYDSPDDRRFHAQPNACWTCGPKVRLLRPDGHVVDVADPVAAAAEMLRQGKIIAVKALGGYQLMADPFDRTATAALRARKERSAKPFALLAQDSATVASYAVLTGQECRLLESPGRPIVLLEAKPGNGMSPDIAPASATLGFMLPATPLQYLLLDSAMPVLIATSANVHDEPMVRTEADALRNMPGLADALLVHDREIHMRADDSVARVIRSTIDPKITFVRRARGYVPDPVPAPFPVPPVLAVGAELKNTVCVGNGEALYLSQHIGDLGSPGNRQFFLDTIAHLTSAFGVAPEYVAHDLHPGFYSTRYASSCRDVRVVAVQHHHAHMASCMADNGLNKPVIGVVFDGTGYGTDGTIWGGEFLVGDYSGFQRKGHLGHFRLPGGDKAIREPGRVAIALLTQHFGADTASLPLNLIRQHDPLELSVLMRMTERGVNAPVTSSMGRMFDACSALLGVCTKVGYEGQAAIELEQLIGWDHTPGRPWPLHLAERDGVVTIDHLPWLEALVSDLAAGHTPAVISRTFHESVVDAIREVCMRLSRACGLKDVVLSGGVFGNQYLLVRAEEDLTRAGMRVHTHTRTPAGDGGISVGQAMIAAASRR